MSLADLTIGRYYPVQSIIHQIDARIKLISVLVITTSTFIVKDNISILLITLLTLYIFYLSKLPIKWLYKSVKPVFFLIAVAFIAQALFTPGQVIYEAGFIAISKEGLNLGIFVSIRVFIIVVLGSILTFTTQPISISDGIESLLSPFKIIKIPVHEISLAVTLAIRFIPELLAEAQKIAFAQQARGTDFKTGNIFIRAKNLIPLFVPLLVSSFIKAENLGKAMESRLYRGSEGRTKYFEGKITSLDIISLFLIIVFFTTTIFLR